LSNEQLVVQPLVASYKLLVGPLIELRETIATPGDTSFLRRQETRKGLFFLDPCLRRDDERKRHEVTLVIPAKAGNQERVFLPGSLPSQG
jgi:hypothetical protein